MAGMVETSGHTFSSVPVRTDYEAFLRCLRREGTPDRVHVIELFLDGEVQEALGRRYGLLEDLNPTAPLYAHQRNLRLQQFLGYDYVRCGVDGLSWNFNRQTTSDTAALSRAAGRSYIDEHVGPITSWEEFERYPWPDPRQFGTESMQWFSRNTPEEMCLIGSGGFAHFAEHLCWLMGYETLCIALFEQRDLVKAIADRLVEIYQAVVKLMLQFDRVKVLWGSDDMGFRTQTLISPADLREFVLPGHKLMAQMAHAAGRPYLLHSCGQLRDIMPDLIDDVGIDGKHSFEDVIEDVVDVKRQYGSRIALLGGIDVDLLCRSDEPTLRQRVRQVLDACMPGGGYCLGTGNSVTNYIPLDHYLAMLDEGRKY
jgi:uroporphyrinogen decarboxylase